MKIKTKVQILTNEKKLTVEEILEAAEAEMIGTENPGFCLNCGERHEGCEPDARNYECDSCGEDKVFGAAEIAISL